VQAEVTLARKPDQKWCSWKKANRYFGPVIDMTGTTFSAVFTRTSNCAVPPALPAHFANVMSSVRMPLPGYSSFHVVLVAEAGVMVGAKAVEVGFGQAILSVILINAMRSFALEMGLSDTV
jgi:hypothetical protein